MLQVVESLHQYSTLTKLGSAYGSRSTQQAMTEAQSRARKQARQQQEKHFYQQAGINSQLVSQLSPSHLY